MNESMVFVVRIWAGARFRAVVRKVDEEQALLFEAPAALTRYFVAFSRDSGRSDTGSAEPKPSDGRAR